jgi:hypothetical protein
MAKAKSKQQQMAAGAALSAKRGERPKSSLKGASKSMVQSMSEEDLHEMASVGRKKLPKRKTASRAGAAKKGSSRKTARKTGAQKSPARKPAGRKSTARKKAAPKR